MNMKLKEKNTLTPLAEVRRPLPDSWKMAIGILKGRRKSMEAHVRKSRKEWD